MLFLLTAPKQRSLQTPEGFPGVEPSLEVRAPVTKASGLGTALEGPEGWAGLLCFTDKGTASDASRATH